ncbi:hypothetical protein [Sphingomonas sp.]
MTRLDDSIQSIRDGTSLYWAFYDLDHVTGEELVEVRFDGMADSDPTFIAPPGWQIDRIERDSVIFVRRYQAVSRDAVAIMLEEMLQHAATHRYRFHSWLHGSALA